MEAPHCRLSPTGNSCAHAFPAAARAEHRGAALARLVAESSAAGHAHGPRCPDVRGRMLRMSEKRVSGIVRAAKDRARVRRTLFADAEKETPPDGHPRAFACLGDRGGRSPWRNQPWVISKPCCDGRMPLPGTHASASRRLRAASFLRWSRRAGFIGKARKKGVRRMSRGRKRRCRSAMGAHVTPVVFDLQTFFSHPSIGPTGGRRSCSAEKAGGGRGKKTGRPRPPWARRLGTRRDVARGVAAITAEAPCRRRGSRRSSGTRRRCSPSRCRPSRR